MRADLASGTCPPRLLIEEPGAFPDLLPPAFQASSMIICRYAGVKQSRPNRMTIPRIFRALGRLESHSAGHRDPPVAGPFGEVGGQL
jgi:hypothetical protein